MKEMELGGTWEIKPVERFDGQYERVDSWLTQELPAHWQQHPQLEYYAGKVVYRRKFKFKPEQDRRFWLTLNGVFYWCTAYLNDCRLAASEGYFSPVSYEISDLLQKDNVLLLEVDCPNEPEKADKHMITGVFHHWDCLDPATNPGGLWLPVEIQASAGTAIREARFYTIYITRDSARVEGQVRLDSDKERKIRVRISFEPETFEGRAHMIEREAFVSQGQHSFVYYTDVPEPRLWWTHDHGRPDLYTLRVEVFEDDAEKPSDVFETRFGIRTFAMRDYIAYLNGRRIYIRGNNYPPGDTRLATMTKERYAQDIKLARECHLNMLRVHAHVDHPELYRVCDEQGMLLWQDFPLQWYYNRDIEPQALRQVEKMVGTLGNHPSIGVWCMHNEPIRQFDTHKKIRAWAVIRWLFSLLFWNWDRDVLDHKLAQRVRFLDPYRFTTRMSGERGLFREEAGDGHWYFGWYFGPLHWFNYLFRRKRNKLKFITEFGAQSFPNLDSSLKFMADKIEDVDWKHLEERHHLQLAFLKPRVNPQHFKDLREFIRATQDYQSRLNQYHIDRLRCLKYKPNGGCVPFVFLDSNPAVQWSVIDYWRTPKSSYYAMQKAMSPVYAFTILEREKVKTGTRSSIPVFLVNDTYRQIDDAVVELKVSSAVGNEILSETVTTSLAPDCMAKAVMNPEIIYKWSGDYSITIELRYGGQSLVNTYRVKVE